MGSLRSQHSGVFAILSVIIFVYFVSFYYNSSFEWQPGALNSISQSANNASFGWTFDHRRDSRNYALSQLQCDAAFPNLWHELERSAFYQQHTGKLKEKDARIDWSHQGTVRAMIYENELYILEVKGCIRPDFRERSNAILQSIHRAVVTSPEPISNVEFSFNIEDNPNDGQAPVGSTWALSRRDADPKMEQVWLMPDFGYWSWATDVVSSYERVLRKIEETEPAFGKKDRRAVWRGATLNSQRESLVNITTGKAWSDVQSIVWGNSNSNMLPIYDHCRYMFVVHTEGRSYSGRLKYIQNCRSVVIIPELEWVEYFHHLLIPDGPMQNYVKVKADFSDLGEKMDYYLSNPKEAERIANNNVEVFRHRYLTPAAQTCYWRRLFETWAKNSFKPEFYHKGENRWRGVPFETYILQDPANRVL